MTLIRTTRRRAVALALAAALCPLFAQAAPFLSADPYGPDTATAAQPDSAEFTVNGAAPIACTLVAVPGGKQPRCDLSSITSSGTYTLVMTVKRAGPSCGNTSATAGQCTFGGSAASVPFAYTLKSGTVGAPQNPLLSAQ